MSGPKIDVAELERQRQAELERQRQEKLRALEEHACAVRRMEALSGKIKAYLNNRVNRFNVFHELRFDVQAMLESANTADQQIRSAISVKPTGITADIYAHASKLDVCLREIEREFNRATSAFDTRVTQHRAVLKNQNERQRIADELANGKEEQRVFNIKSRGTVHLLFKKRMNRPPAFFDFYFTK